jgi:cytochrome c556
VRCKRFVPVNRRPLDARRLSLLCFAGALNPQTERPSMAGLNGRIALVGALATLLAGAALAASLSGAEAAKARMDHMKALGAASKALGDQMRSGAPDPAVVKAQAAKIAAAADAIPTWFPAGSGPESGAKTHARPIVWSDPADFTAARNKLVAAAADLDRAAAAGDMAAVGAALHPVGAACKGCHDKFKVPDKT